MTITTTATTTTTNPDARLCPCHMQPVVWRHRRDESSEYRVTHLCAVDGLDLGFGGGVRLEDLGEAT